jgi:hypothetical protein
MITVACFYQVVTCIVGSSRKLVRIIVGCCYHVVHGNLESWGKAGKDIGSRLLPGIAQPLLPRFAFYHIDV